MIMRIVFGLSKIQQMPGIAYALVRSEHETAIYPRPVEDVQGNEEREQEFEAFLKKHKVALVISNVFTRAIAGITNRLGVKYAVWCMDSPAFATGVPEAAYDNCYLFYFDHREYELKKQSGQRNVYHLPLAADVISGGGLVITDEEVRKYGCDMSFVGSLYTKNLYDEVIERFSPEQQNSFSEIIEQSAFLWDGRDRLQIPSELVRSVRELCPEVFDKPYEISDEYLLQTLFVGRKLTQVERTLLMELLAQQFDIHLYTNDTEQVPEGVRRFPRIDAGDGALKVFYSSKINLNITLRSIAGGVPARVFDVMSVGGFMLSNWQEEIPELFAEDKEIVTYKTLEELIDKADYYLRHDNERIRIGVNGYQKVKAQHTYEQRIEKIISILFPMP